MSKVQVFRGEDGLWFARLRAANGEILATSEGYIRKVDAVRWRARVVRAMLFARLEVI